MWKTSIWLVSQYCVLLAEKKESIVDTLQQLLYSAAGFIVKKVGSVFFLKISLELYFYVKFCMPSIDIHNFFVKYKAG